MDFGERAVRSKPIKKASFGELTFFETTCADEARKPEVHGMNTIRTPNKSKLGKGCLMHGPSELALKPRVDEVSDYDFLRGVASLFTADSNVTAICLYQSAGCDEPRHIEVAGKLPLVALKGLRRIGRRDEAPLLGWRNGESGSAPLFALESVGHLAGLLAEARGGRA